MDATLKSKAAKAARTMGFSSLQETVRLFLTKLASGALRVSLNTIDADEYVSPKAIARYDKLERNIKSGKEPVYQATSAQDMLDQLYGRKPLVRVNIP